jgi:hypothetical protein
VFVNCYITLQHLTSVILHCEVPQGLRGIVTFLNGYYTLWHSYWFSWHGHYIPQCLCHVQMFIRGFVTLRRYFGWCWIVMFLNGYGVLQCSSLFTYVEFQHFALVMSHCYISSRIMLHYNIPQVFWWITAFLNVYVTLWCSYWLNYAKLLHSSMVMFHFEFHERLFIVTTKSSSNKSVKSQSPRC